MTSIDVDLFPTDVTQLNPEHRMLHEAASRLLGSAPVNVMLEDDPDERSRTFVFDMSVASRLNNFFPIDVAEAAQKRLVTGRVHTLPYPSSVFDENAEGVVESRLWFEGHIPFRKLIVAAGKKLVHRDYQQRWDSEADEFRALAEAPVAVSQGFSTWQREGRFALPTSEEVQGDVVVTQTALDGTIAVRGREYAFSRHDVATSVATYMPGVDVADATYTVSSSNPYFVARIATGGGDPRIVLPGQTRSTRLPLSPVEMTNALEAIADHHEAA